MFLFTSKSTLALGVTQLRGQWILVVLSPEVKYPEREATHSLLSSF